MVLVAAAATDLEERIIPNRLMAAGALLALVLWTIADPSRLPENLIAGAAAGGLLLAAAVAYPAGMGMGDVKLAAVMGLFLGRLVGPALFIGFAAGALVGHRARRSARSGGPQAGCAVRALPGTRRCAGAAVRRRADRLVCGRLRAFVLSGSHCQCR